MEDDPIFDDGHHIRNIFIDRRNKRRCFIGDRIMIEPNVVWRAVPAEVMIVVNIIGTSEDPTPEVPDEEWL